MKRKASTQPQTCPDCRGSGEYVGFTVKEPCRACNGTGSLRRLRVDVVKRLDFDRRVYRYLLSREGYDVCCYSDVDDYLDQFDAAPDCIIAGFMFQRSDVFPLLWELERRGLDTPVIICTSINLDRSDLPDGVTELFTGVSPLTPARLSEAVRSAIAKKRPPGE
jgi:FixJ family two-component response regulator